MPDNTPKPTVLGINQAEKMVWVHQLEKKLKIYTRLAEMGVGNRNTALVIHPIVRY